MKIEQTGGVKRRLFGSVLLSLGLLNYLLSLKAGFFLDRYNLLILLSGALLFISGFIARRRAKAVQTGG